MKQLTDKTRSLLHQLESLPLSGSPRSGNETSENIRDAVSLINDIASAREWPALIYLAPYLVSGEKRICDSAVDAVELIIESMRISNLLQVDERLRAGIWTVPSYLQLWDEMTQRKLDSWFFGKARLSLCGLSSFHRNGYVREAAVCQLAKHMDGKELPFLLIRLCDWVPKISGIAANEVERRIKLTYARHFVDNLGLLDRVAQRQRYAVRGRGGLIGLVKTFLKEPGNRDVLIGGLSHEDRDVRRSCIALLVEIPDIDPNFIISMMIKDADLTLRRGLFKLADKLPTEHKIVVLKKLACDRVGLIRRDALRELCELSDDQGREYAQLALLDKSAIVRECGRTKLWRLEPEFDARMFYLQSVQEQGPASISPAAIYGLGETGKEEDLKFILPLIDHGQPVQQQAAICAIGKLGAEKYVDQLLIFLPSPNEGLSSAAGKGLEKVAHLVDPSALWDVAASTSHWHVKRKALKLLNRTEKWERVVYMLQAASSDDKRTVEFANTCLENWLRQYALTWPYTLPTEKQATRLKLGMKDAQQTLSGRVRATLDECLKLCR